MLVCRLEELVSPDSYRALVDTVVKQLQRGIDDDEFREGVLRAKWMVSLPLISLTLIR